MQLGRRPRRPSQSVPEWAAQDLLRRKPVLGLFGKKRRIEDTEAYKKGREFSEQAIAVFERFFEGRFGPVKKNFMEVLRKQLLEALHRTDAPPLTVGRIEYQIFCENVDKMQSDMRSEINLVMSDWLTTADAIGTRDDFVRLFETRVGDYLADLKLSGLHLLVDYAVPLKDADAAWRQANPEKAVDFAEEPLPDRE